MSADRAGMTRRQMLACCSTGFGAVALSGLMRPAMAATGAPHFEAKAKHVIFCYMSGGVSQVDSGPELDESRLPEDVLQFMQAFSSRDLFESNARHILVGIRNEEPLP